MSDDAVTLYWTSETMTGDAGCPSNPVVVRTVELGSPLGDRELRDGSSWPARDVLGSTLSDR